MSEQSKCAYKESRVKDIAFTAVLASIVGALVGPVIRLTLNLRKGPMAESGLPTVNELHAEKPHLFEPDDLAARLDRLVGPPLPFPTTHHRTTPSPNESTESRDKPKDTSDL